MIWSTFLHLTSLFRYVRFRHRQKSSDEFLLANRSMDVRRAFKMHNRPWLTFSLLDLASRLFVDGKLHVSNHTSWSVKRKLSIRHSIYCYQHFLWHRDSDCCLLVLADILQSEGNKCIWGKNASQLIVTLWSRQLNCIIWPTAKISTSTIPDFTLSTCWF